MAAPTSRVTVSWKDHNAEASHLGLWITTLTAGNIVAQTTLINSLVSALSAVTLGNQQRQSIVLSDSNLAGGYPTDPFAQRETKWLLRYYDSVTFEKFVSEVPCADLALLSPYTQFADMTGTEFAALKTAWELIVRGPNDNNLTILESAQHVGRNL